MHIFSDSALQLADDIFTVAVDFDMVSILNNSFYSPPKMLTNNPACFSMASLFSF
jgi:hypothetical protein